MALLRMKTQCFFIVFLIIACLALFSLFMDFPDFLFSSSKLNIFKAGSEAQEEGQGEDKAAAEPPLILGWNSFFNVDSTMSALLNVSAASLPRCPFKCKYSNDTRLESTASVIVFHARDQLQPLPQHRQPHQFFAFFLQESPLNSGDFYRQLSPDFFNISVTFRRDSDVFFPYDAFQPLDGAEGESWSEEEIHTIMANKSRLALVMTSNCKTSSKREQFLAELGRHMQITELGKCTQNEGCRGECMDRMIDSHFFYLAFENSVCLQYVTEKFWHLKRLIVPVVLSRGVFTGMDVSAEAFIAADDFANARELAKHLKALAFDRKRYARHFQWTGQFKRTPFAPEPLCQLCQLANRQPRPPKRIPDIVQWWEGRGQCEDGFAERKLLSREKRRFVGKL